MAMDWIKMRADLQSHPKVVRILSALNVDKFRTIGGLHAVWSVFDTHSVDGVLSGYTPAALDHIIGWDGFSAQMIAVGWLHFDGINSLTIPEFTEHNGKSAKRRAEDQKRKRLGRNADESGKDCGQNADKKRTREREDIKEAKPPSAAPLPDLIFGAGLKFLTDRGVQEPKARSVLGKIKKDIGDDACWDLLNRAEQLDITDPVSWLIAAAKNQKSAVTPKAHPNDVDWSEVR